MNNLAINGEKFIVDYLGIYIIQETDVLYDKTIHILKVYISDVLIIK